MSDPAAASAGRNGRQDGQLPPLKVPVTFRASVQTQEALTYIQNSLNIDKTAAIETAIARLAAWLKAGVCTPHRENEQGSGGSDNYE